VESGFILTADTHLSDSALAEYRWDLFRFLKETARAQGVNEIVVAGDLVDKKDRHPASFVNRLVDEVLNLADQGLCITIMSGNHDYTDPACPFFSFLHGAHENVRYLIKPSSLRIGGVHCLLIPHSKNGIACKTLPREGCYDVVICHQTFKGVRVNGRELDGLYVDRMSPEAVGSARVFSGDIHEPQKVGNVQYIGAPYHVVFGDSYQGRVLHVHSTGYEAIPYVTAPKKHNIRITANEIDSNWTSEIYDGDFVRVHLVLAPAEALDVNALRDRVRKRLKNVISCGVLVEVAAPTKRRRVFEEATSWDDKSIFARYCSSNGVSRELTKFAEEVYGL
jgi:predicted phosphodiesterase